jgi:hypothetical protein
VDIAATFVLGLKVAHDQGTSIRFRCHGGQGRCFVFPIDKLRPMSSSFTCEELATISALASALRPSARDGFLRLISVTCITVDMRCPPVTNEPDVPASKSSLD